jgi:hypothetical protein
MSNSKADSVPPVHSRREIEDSVRKHLKDLKIASGYNNNLINPLEPKEEEINNAITQLRLYLNAPESLNFCIYNNLACAYALIFDFQSAIEHINLASEKKDKTCGPNNNTIMDDNLKCITIAWEIWPDG